MVVLYSGVCTIIVKATSGKYLRRQELPAYLINVRSKQCVRVTLQPVAIHILTHEHTTYVYTQRSSDKNTFYLQRRDTFSRILINIRTPLYECITHAYDNNIVKRYSHIMRKTKRKAWRKLISLLTRNNPLSFVVFLTVWLRQSYHRYRVIVYCAKAMQT